MSSSVQSSGTTWTDTFNESNYQAYARGIREEFAIIGLLVGLYGTLAVLSLLSIYALVAQCTPKMRLKTVILSLTILALFTSTTIYVVASILLAKSNYLSLLIYSGVILWPNANIPPQGVISQLFPVKIYSRIQYCSGTAALTLNVIFGGAIVCWRACVVWRRNRAVKVVCIVFLLATFVLGVIDTNMSCSSGTTFVYRATQTIELMVAIGFAYGGFPAGIAASVLSLAINLVSTLLIGFKAWRSRKRLREYLAAGPRASQVKKLFALILESGTLYLAFWVAVVYFQVDKYKFIQPANATYEKGLFEIFYVAIFGSLVPLIAVYPTIIIVLVALNTSHMERALLESAQSPSMQVLPPSFTIQTTTTTTSDHEVRSPQRVSEVLIINGEYPRCRDGQGTKDPSGRTSLDTEKKVEDII